MKEVKVMNNRKNNLKQLRENAGLSQYALADKIHYLNQSQIAKIETGKRKMTAVDMITIAQALNVPVETLIDL